MMYEEWLGKKFCFQKDSECELYELSKGSQLEWQRIQIFVLRVMQELLQWPKLMVQKVSCHS